MESRIVYIGDEVTAAGHRLAGLSTRAPGSGEETAVLREELARAALILISRRVAGRIGRPELQHALAQASPLTLVMPEGAALPPGIDIAARVRLQLGVEEA